MSNDLVEALSSGDDARRTKTLQRVVNLFLKDAEYLKPEQIALFDIVIGRLASAIEAEVRVELSEQLADIANAPYGVIKSLANDDIDIARPVLARSLCLSDRDLIDIALVKGLGHMGEIAQRKTLTEPLTDILVTKGDSVVIQNVANNQGARLSPQGFNLLVERARADETLQLALEQRPDLPPAHIQQLVLIARERVRQNLSSKIESSFLDQAISRSTSRVEACVTLSGRNISGALQKVQVLQATQSLNELEIVKYASQGERDMIICAVSAMSGLSIISTEKLFTGADADLLLVVGKSLEWQWDSVKTLIGLRAEGVRAAQRLRRAEETYAKLSIESARRVIHFIKSRELGPASEQMLTKT